MNNIYYSQTLNLVIDFRKLIGISFDRKAYALCLMYPAYESNHLLSLTDQADEAKLIVLEYYKYARTNK